MEKYENKSIELRKHLKNAIEYMKHDRVNFPLPKTVAFLEGYVDGLESWDLEGYDAWIKDQKENADQTRGNMSIQVADDKNGDFTIEV